MQMFMHYGISIAPVDDSMLISYVVDGTQHGHGMDELAQTFSITPTIKYEDVTGSGKSQITFDLVPLDKALHTRRRTRISRSACIKMFKPRLVREHMATVYETLNARSRP